MTCALAVKAREILAEPHANYCQLQTTVHALEQKLHDATADTFALLLTCKRELYLHQTELKLHSQWQRLGHDADFITTHPDCVDFLLQSGLAFQIAGLRNSCVVDAQKHLIKKDSDGHPLLLLEGKLTRWEQIKENFSFLKLYHTLYTKTNPDERWTYTSYAGITNADIYHFTKPFHVYEIHNDLVAKLQAYAQTYNPDTSAKYVLQICTSLGKLCAKSPTLLKKVGEKLASHYAVRIITPDGKVFSFGLRRDIGELDFVDVSTALGQVKGRIAMNDYDELRPHSGRYVTTLPLSEQAAAAILQDITSSNQKTPPFDYLVANCVELACRCLKTAGVHVETRASIEGCLQDIAMSFFKNIPYLGDSVRKVHQAAKALYNQMPSMPGCITACIKILTYVPTKITALCKNILVFSMGWASSSPTLSALRQTRSLHCFDFLNENLSNLRYPRNLLRWQKQQVTTCCHDYEGKPQLALLPPNLLTATGPCI